MVLDIEIKLKKQNEIPILDINGEIDVYTCPKLNDALERVIGAGNHHIVINLEEVNYIDSTGLGALASGANKVASFGGGLNIICTKPQVRKIFDVSGLLKKNLLLFDEEAKAVESAHNAAKKR